MIELLNLVYYCRRGLCGREYVPTEQAYYNNIFDVSECLIIIDEIIL